MFETVKTLATGVITNVAFPGNVLNSILEILGPVSPVALGSDNSQNISINGFHSFSL